MIGQTISHYKILEKLGEGGMGVVYKAHDNELDRDVALKFLSHHLIANESDKKRFIQEAKAAAILNHPNICTIHGIEEASDPTTGDKQTFIVMEYVDGKTLKDVQPTLTYKQCLDIATQIAKGLAAAHEHGIVHRDIKPENIMVRKDGIVVIMDFGLARLRGASRLTQAGTTSGTAGYMAPEQVLGQECDHRADIFSLGVVLYELFSGQSPFKGVHASALLYEIVNIEAPPISSIKPDINPELDSLIQECLAKDPNERIQSAAEVRRKLGIITGETRSHTKTSTQHEVAHAAQQPAAQASHWFFIAGKKWLTFSIIGLLGVLLSVISVIHFTEPANLDLSKYKMTPIATDAEPQQDPAWSPDGKSIAYTKRVYGVFQVFIRNLDSPLPSKLTNLSSNAQLPFWSPDGNLVYFISGPNLYSIGLAGGEARRVLGPINAATISPDGKTIVYWSTEIVQGNATAYVVSVNDTSGRRYRPAPFEITGGYVPNFIQFSPDGRRIGLSMRAPGARGAQFWILPWPDGEDVKPFKVFEEARFDDPPSFSWMPDSRRILLSSGKILWVGDVETEKMRRVFSSIEEKIRNPNVSPDGKRIVSTIQREDLNIMQLPLDGSQPKRIMASSRNEMSLSYSSAGNKAIYINDRSGEDEIWLTTNGVDVRPIITKKDFPNYRGYAIIPATISPDGSRVAFVVWSADFGPRVFVTSTEGGKPTRILSGENVEVICSWSSDSKYLAVYVLEKDALKLAIVRVGAQEPPRFIPNTDSIDTWVNWSPDNKWIAYGSRQNIVLVSPDGKTRKTIASPEAASPMNYLLVWSRDGATIYVASSRRRGARLHAVDINSGRSRKIAEYGDDIEFQARYTYALFGCLAPDGKSIVTTAVDYKSDIWILDGLPQK